MLNFKELPKSGDAFELLIREILLIKGFHVQWSGKGPDGGRDIVCYEDRSSEFQADRKTWLIQCKHNAHSGTSVGITDLDDIISSCSQHGADAYLLACSTVPSSAVINRLEGITQNLSQKITATYWDSTIIEQKLSTPELWRVAQLFFPISSAGSTWEIYATENPNYWIVNYKGYHFHLINRIGSTSKYHFPSIDNRITNINEINSKLPENHFLRIRAVYFDDKNGNYSWFIDYMFPRDESPLFSARQIAKSMGDGWALEDGQVYMFDVVNRPYSPWSDHYDKDHYDYYKDDSISFRTGFKREQPYNEYNKEFGESLAEEEKVRKNTTLGFNTFTTALKSVPYIRLIRAVNSGVENIIKLNSSRDWGQVIEDNDIALDHLFSPWFLIHVGEYEDDFFKMLSYFDMSIDYSFRLTRAYIFAPDNDGKAEYDGDNDSFEMKIKVFDLNAHTAVVVRQELNKYFESCALAITRYCTDNAQLFASIAAKAAE
jgi:hypothetical protein